MDSDEENVPPRAETVLRSVFAILLYLAAVACVIMFLSTEENGYSYVLVAVVGFVIAHYVHPRRIGGATEDSYDFVDICFSVIDATFEILKLPFRIISWIVGSDQPFRLLTLEMPGGALSVTGFLLIVLAVITILFQLLIVSRVKRQ